MGNTKLTGFHNVKINTLITICEGLKRLVYPSIPADLHRASGITITTVYDYVQLLEKANVLTTEKHGKFVLIRKGDNFTSFINAVETLYKTLGNENDN